jgi:DNA helicase-2/ATP-dependent DNA helicase PcrA
VWLHGNLPWLSQGLPSLACVPVNPRAVLGRGVVVNAGDPVPQPWAGAPEVVVDDDALADPAGVVALLHEAWAARRAVVVRLAADPALFRVPPDIEVAEPWRLDPGFELWHDRLHFLVWANTYDARDGEPVWWWGRKAQRLGAAAAPHGDAIDGSAAADVVLPDGTPAWIDGGPRGDVGAGTVGEAVVVHAESIDWGRLTPVPAHDGGPADGRLAADQLRAVDHGSGPARVIAPAGSGKTRVLTERLRHLLVARGYEPEGVVAVAYNRKARDEMVARTAGVGARILTLNALGYELVASGLGRRPDVLDVRDVRRLLEPLVPRGARRLNTDPLAPYVEALSAVRLGLRDPIAVEDERGDVPGLADAFPAYRAELRRRGVVDFDEQVLLAIELLLGDGAFRRGQQARHRHLLVDEFQDLTPAHVLLIRLLSTPRLDVFGVGDDDQVIYGHAGASPRFLTDFGRFFPAAAEHALEVNYRCPPAVVDAASHLLTRNRVRVVKRIRAARADPVTAEPESDALRVRRHVPQEGATELVDVVRAWLGGDGAARPCDIAVLTRVGSLLLAPHVALVDAGVPVASILRADALTRTGLRAALAYLRIAADDGRMEPRDLIEVYRRPSRSLPNWIERWLGRCHSVDDVRRAAGRIDDVKVAAKVDGLATDLAKLAALARSGSTRSVLEHVRDAVGLGQAVDLLDATGVAGESHRDDLEALLQVADLHPDPGGFEPWLRTALTRPGDDDGVVLSTIHRVKGREWPRVVVFGATDGIMPHRLSHGRAALEEERRVFHVAITRAIGQVEVLADASRPSPFLAELDRDATPAEVEAEPMADASPPPRRPADMPAPQAAPVDPGTARLEAALREWRRARSRADGVPAFVVIHDRHLVAIAERRPMDRAALAACPGIGPAKLAAYGDELVSLVRGVGGEPSPFSPSDS